MLNGYRGIFTYVHSMIIFIKNSYFGKLIEK